MGIWYNEIPEHTVVWVANRQVPLSDPESSQLSISSDGNMVLLDRAKSSPTSWSTNTTGKAANSTTVAIILDTGNLVLANASNTSVILWQSFDHFGDTWLPVGKLGRNKLTGEATCLVTRKGYNDPSPGMFSLELDPGGSSQYLLSWNGSRRYWSSGNWTAGGGMFSDVPEMMASKQDPLLLYSFRYVDGENESYFTYDVKHDNAVLTRFVVNVTGQVKSLPENGILPLLGFCADRSTRRLLVYEHMPNGSLDRHLFGSSSAALSWETRYKIALGVARGLHYLHEKCRDCIIHCDIKPENILLDGTFAAKVADFGLAKLMGRDFSRVLTTTRGTVGYLAPEWIAGTAVTTKADVYSYGMTLFEIVIVSGRRNVEQQR
uniref:non-specific serine/threonine protein kinase n=1 Tax=Leersia perrieri TaxID=77586 RepID=A0A0D9V2D4_9ORYZ